MVALPRQLGSAQARLDTLQTPEPLLGHASNSSNNDRYEKLAGEYAENEQKNEEK